MVMLPLRLINISLLDDMSVLVWLMACCDPVSAIVAPDMLSVGCFCSVVVTGAGAAGSDPPQAREKRATISRAGMKIVAASRHLL